MSVEIDTQSACLRCGRSHPRNSDNCPGSKARCHYCQKIGHFQRVCLRKKKGIPPVKVLNFAEKGESTNMPPSGEQPYTPPSGEQRHTTQQQQQYDEPEEFRVLASTSNRYGSLKTVHLLVEGVPMEFVPDSGSTINVIRKSNLTPEQCSKISPHSQVFVKPYGAAAYQSLGTIVLPVKFGSINAMGRFQVIDNEAVNILSVDASQKLGI